MLKFREYCKKDLNKPKQLVIMLHGYGSNKDDLINIAPDLALYLPDAHFICPDACQNFEDHSMRNAYQWFSLADRSTEAMLEGAKKATVILEEFIKVQLERFALSDRQLVLIGFSQGGMMTLHAGLNMAFTPRALLCYSGILIAPNELRKLKGRPLGKHSYDEQTQTQDIVLVHGKMDEVVPLESMQRGAIALLKQNATLHTLVCENLGHGIDNEGLKFGARILESIFYS